MLYLLQQGVPEWSDKVTYPGNAVIKYNGILYIATNENNNAKPSTTTTKWKKLLDDACLTKKGSFSLIQQCIARNYKKGTFATTIHNVIKPFSYENYTKILNALYNHNNGSVPVSAREKTATTFTSEAFRGAGGNVIYTTLTIYVCGYYSIV